LRSIAKSAIPVLILGCTGTGKELAAKAVHEISARSGQFCAVNCGAIPSNLVESTLFGHVKGAFSGALTNQTGMVRTADNGTLFLDEIGDLPLDAQTALLRVLQEGEVLPVGATQPVKVDVRVVAATHQPLQELIDQKRFRADLYARLAGYVHRLRPLEMRLEDFGVLFALLLRRAAGTAAVDVTLTTEAGWALMRHAWPLNVRELEQAISRATVLSEGAPLNIKHFPFVLESAPRSTSSVQVKGESVDVALRQQLDELMREHHGNVTAVARVLGKAPTQIQRWLKRVGLMADGYRG
jgi:DNA-binding NtrC family response regulator